MGRTFNVFRLVFFWIVVVVACIRVVVGGDSTVVFFKVGGCYEDGATEFANVDSTERGVLFDVEPEIEVCLLIGSDRVVQSTERLSSRM
jgi:hypothetical protein